MANPRKHKSPTLREIIHRVPKDGDLFPDVFSRDAVVAAIDRLFSQRNMHGYGSWFVLECARVLSRQYSELAAAMLERAADHILARDGLRGAAECQRLVSEAATCWLISGNVDEFNDTNLHRVSISLKSTSQRDLFVTEEHLESLDMLFEAADQYFESGEYERALGTCDLVKREMETEEQYQYAGWAALRCMKICAKIEDWTKVEEYAMEAGALFELSEEEMDDDDLLLTIYLLAKARFHLSASLHAEYIIDTLSLCKEDRDELVRLNIDIFELNQMLARCYAVRGEQRFHKWSQQDKPHLLKDAESDLVRSVTMMEEEPQLPRRALARAYAALSTVYSAMVCVEEAAEYRERAMLLGFDLSED